MQSILVFISIFIMGDRAIKNDSVKATPTINPIKSELIRYWRSGYFFFIYQKTPYLYDRQNLKIAQQKTNKNKAWNMLCICFINLYLIISLKLLYMCR